MRSLPVLFAFLVVGVSSAQIKVINTGTSENLISILPFQTNYLISGSRTYLSKCYDECNTLTPLNLPNFPNSNYYFTVNRPDTSVLYITASSFQNLNLTYWKSSDGGYNWTKKFDTVSTAIYSGITQFFDTLNGISFNANEVCISTSDGFNSYGFGTWPDTWPMRAEVHGDSTIILSSCGVYCGILISKNRGATWKGVGPPSGLGQNAVNDFKFLNKDTIFAITITQNLAASFLKSFDSGNSWNKIRFAGGMTNPRESFRKLCVKSRDQLYIVCHDEYIDEAVILKTTDLGQSWSRFEMQMKDKLNDMKFINDSVALICGDNGLLFKWNTKTAIFTGIKENELNELPVTVFPNPITDKLFIQLNENSGQVRATITNVLGQTIRESGFNDTKGEIEFAAVPNGIYFLRLEGQSGQRIIKVVKE